VTSVVTVDELATLRQRHVELAAVSRSLQRLGHDVPAEVATELASLEVAVVDVVIRCLICGAFGTSPAQVDGDATPRAAICADCDRGVFAGDEDPDAVQR
jgi:hypothetical protein